MSTDNPIADESILARGKDIPFDRLDDELPDRDAHGGMCYSFNLTARQVWLSLEEPLALGDLCRKLAEFYDANEQMVRADLPELLAALQRQGLIAVSDPTA